MADNPWRRRRIACGNLAPRPLDKQHVRDKLIEPEQYITKWGDDMPKIRDWKWPA